MQSVPMKFDVGAESEFLEGSMRIMDLGQREVGVVRWRGKFHALRNICPHLGAPVCTGPMAAFLTEGEQAWQLEADWERLVLTCPWHRWEFDIATGRSVLGAYAVKTYDVKVVGNRVVVEVGRSNSESSQIEEVLSTRLAPTMSVAKSTREPHREVGQ